MHKVSHTCTHLCCQAQQTISVPEQQITLIVALQVKAAADDTFGAILQRAVLLDQARQEQQLAIRFKAVLGFRARLRDFCHSRQYTQIVPAYEQASRQIQSQVEAATESRVDWGPLQTLMDEVSHACLTRGHGMPTSCALKLSGCYSAWLHS